MPYMQMKMHALGLNWSSEIEIFDLYPSLESKHLVWQFEIICIFEILVLTQTDSKVLEVFFSSIFVKSTKSVLLL